MTASCKTCEIDRLRAALAAAEDELEFLRAHQPAWQPDPEVPCFCDAAQERRRRAVAGRLMIDTTRNPVGLQVDAQEGRPADTSDLRVVEETRVLKPGDRLLIRVSPQTDAATVSRLREALRKDMPGVKFAVVACEEFGVQTDPEAS